MQRRAEQNDSPEKSHPNIWIFAYCHVWSFLLVDWMKKGRSILNTYLFRLWRETVIRVTPRILNFGNRLFPVDVKQKEEEMISWENSRKSFLEKYLLKLGRELWNGIEMLCVFSINWIPPKIYVLLAFACVYIFKRRGNHLKCDKT